MAKSLALINKDIAQHYRLANLLSPPEAIELTHLHDQMSDILNKQPSKQTEDNLDEYFRLLFKYIKLLNVLKFPETTKEIVQPQQQQQQQPTIRRRPSQQQIITTRKLPTTAAIIPSKVAPSVTLNPMIEALRESTPPLPKIASPEPPPPPVKPPTKRTDSLEAHMKHFDPNDYKNTLSALRLIRQSDPSFQIISDDPSHQLHIKGKIYATQTIQNVISKLEDSSFNDTKLTDPEERFFFKQVFLPSVTQNVNAVSKSLLAKLPGFNRYVSNLPRESRAATAAAAVDKQGSGKRKRKLPEGKIHLKRWIKHMRSVHNPFDLKNKTVRFDVSVHK
jgi:hypothetical protein